ncbi:MAG TPA: hypothetical protein VHD56_10415 [Tepidisphaeraceae bacterium]|nr:hypothetical protein [Tepidisphaeraceae bacterium]
MQTLRNLLGSLVLLFAVAELAAVQTATPSMIDVSQASAPLFDDPVFHGATDPFVIWNPARNQWFMYYTQRRATLANPNGVDWVHGSAIGIATAPDGIHWTYLGTAKGDHDLTDPMAAKGAGPEPGITWWAPCFLWENNIMHMFVTAVDGVYTNWTGKRNIMHFASEDGVNFKYVSTAKLSSDRVIDATVYKVNDTWYMVYKDEAAGSRTTRSESKDLDNWTNAKVVSPDGSQEAPFPFFWRGKWWMMVDAVSNRGLRIYTSENGIDGWKNVTTILGARDGTRPRDNNVGHHPGIVLQGQGDSQQCLVYYFTHQGNQTVMQLAELEMGADGKPVCNRNKYAPATQPAANPTGM